MNKFQLPAGERWRRAHSNITSRCCVFKLQTCLDAADADAEADCAVTPEASIGRPSVAFDGAGDDIRWGKKEKHVRFMFFFCG